MIAQKQILVVEDNALNREMLVDILSDQYEVLEAENGQAALDLMEQRKDDISLILLDLIMPVMDGLTFLDHLKQDREWKLIPVIVMTQRNKEEDELAALAHGATDFIAKPYRPQIILHRISSLIKLREDAAMANQFKYDRLTGLFSREYFYQRVRERLEEDPEGAYNIVCSNIENFKVYNDSFGAKEGDRLLQEIAVKILQRIEQGELCGCFGADRFLILQKQEHDVAKWENLMEGIQNDRHVYQNIVAMQWGVYRIHDKSVAVDKMCDRALLAVDSIKGKYDQNIAYYNDAFREHLLREQAITESMKSALQSGQFTVYFQPKYSLKGDSVVGAEALVRWIHPEWGFMSPGEFIPLFEKNGFITELDQYVWEQVCRQLQEWKKKGLPMVPVSVNVSRADVYKVELVETLKNLTRKYDIDPSYLHLEITESAYTDTQELLLGTIEALRDNGFAIEMDDFGSGYSSLNMLTEMKLDVLKLDMKFVRNETAKTEEDSILKFVVDLAHWKKLMVVAEGTETMEQIQHLRAVDCDCAQGFYYARPMPGEEFEQLLRNSPGARKEQQFA